VSPFSCPRCKLLLFPSLLLSSLVHFIRALALRYLEFSCGELRPRKLFSLELSRGELRPRKLFSLFPRPLLSKALSFILHPSPGVIRDLIQNRVHVHNH
jgi:hypothetical protein